MRTYAYGSRQQPLEYLSTGRDLRYLTTPTLFASTSPGTTYLAGSSACSSSSSSGGCALPRQGLLRCGVHHATDSQASSVQHGTMSSPSKRARMPDIVGKEYSCTTHYDSITKSPSYDSAGVSLQHDSLPRGHASPLSGHSLFMF